MKRLNTLLCAMCAAAAVSAEDIDVNKFNYAGPYKVHAPYMIDSVDVKAAKYDTATLLDSPLKLSAAKGGKTVSAPLIAGGKGDELHLAAFTLTSRKRTPATINVSGLKRYRLYVDGKSLGGESANGHKVTLSPSAHDVVIKFMTTEGQADTLRVSVSCQAQGALTVADDGAKTKKHYGIRDLICGENYSGVSVSPDGKYMIVRKYWTDTSGKTDQSFIVREFASGKVLTETPKYIRWTPKGGKYYYLRYNISGTSELVTVNPATGEETVMASAIPDGHFTITPDEKALIYTLNTEGPKERKDVYEVIEPDDRQPGWRGRSQLARYDMATGVMQPLTYGHHSAMLYDVSADSRYILFGTSRSRLTQRPTTLMSLYRLDMNTMACDTLVEDDGFINAAVFSPDGREALITGSPEALGGVGKNVGEGQTPSMVDLQLYIMRLSDLSVRPVTKYFNPCVESATWSRADGNIYFKAEDKDRLSVFRLAPATGKITPIALPEEYIREFSVAGESGNIAFCGQSASNLDRLYKTDTKSLKPVLVDDLSARRLEGFEIGECRAWSHVNSLGDTLCCRYYLPPSFDSSRKYPVIVNYYGGCSPTSRCFDSRYPHHVYAAMGYVVLVINPRGATGFGQEFSARHVDTAGDGVAEDIIESTKAFCAEHAFADDKKIGCIGASYGGFMTQYLQTKTDMFAAAISHAGISDHTSYWGEGYWGYSYSEVSMANEYPWTNRDLYVEHSPLYNADKIHTPLLFLHGTADTNVPVGESIQMFTALKLLGRETAMVLVDGQDHHITDFQKRLRWQSTIFAWFAKWLQDDPSWWDEMYGKKNL